MHDRQSKSYRITIRAILMAFIFVQGMVPFLGFIPIGFISLTIIHITVIVAAITLGTKDGMFVGLVWGLTTMIRAWTMPTTPLDTLIFTNPLVSVFPRILVGLVAGFVFSFLYKKTKSTFLPTIVAATLGTLTNTILVLGSMGLLYTAPVAAQYGTTANGLFAVLAVAVLTNGIPEVIGAIIITPMITKAIFAATKLSPELRH
ncbi:ECF transporter S component [Vagococcus salmoninarum]|uniref:ECF transporter S component n=1 Tax=Vagococcus salmoninarum TaxID=2739 RepID=UPI001880CB58|nr:ECF transporter S component [Vagococcus salmoninarum]MBE9388248.1 ECF transporter S component [Vagococcus salmoninarum]